MNKVIRNAAYDAFLEVPEALAAGTRIKDVRDEPLRPGGRVIMTLFERVRGGRPHPRMRFAYADVADPRPPGALLQPADAPTTAAALREAIEAALRTHAELLAARDLDPALVPATSPKYWRNRIRVERIDALLQEVRTTVEAWLADGTLPASERAACYRAVAELEDEAHAGIMEFDDADTGTYHSFGHDAPFVHYLERVLASLPEEGTEAMALLHPGTRESVRRQRRQARSHLDWLMRYKYAYEGIEETDIERSLGGFLVDRGSGRIASEAADSDPLAPTHELLRIAPAADHPHAGAWVYRHPDGTLRLQDHATVDVDPDLLRSAPCEPEALTFRRAPDDPHLRPGLRLDWDDNGFVQQGPIEWVSWAGHCDVKAVMEQLGVTLTEDPPPRVEEYRSDTGRTTVYDRNLLLEMVASVLELGSSYSCIDGTGQLRRGILRFGGSRNDSRPDRLQLTGIARGKSFRWPMANRRERLRVTAIELPDGSRPDMGTVFFRHLPDPQAVTFRKNPRYIKTVEGDYNVIDVSGARIEARVKVDAVDETTGFLMEREETIVLDLRGAPGGATAEGRSFLGTHVEDAAERKLLRVYHEPARSRVVAEMDRYELRNGKWTATRVPDEDMEIPLRTPLRCTLSREMKRDDPSQFTTLLHLALRQAKNICADTDHASAVWNGVVTRLEVRKTGANPQERTERWQVDLRARFGEATLDYLVRRDERGQPEAYCPATSDQHWGRWPDFLWHDEPDVGSKGYENGDWIVNETMIDRELVDVRVDESVPSGFYVFDDHVKNVFELIFAGLAGYRYTVVHNDKRYGFGTVEGWTAAVDALAQRRAAVGFQDEG